MVEKKTRFLFDHYFPSPAQWSSLTAPGGPAWSAALTENILLRVNLDLIFLPSTLLQLPCHLCSHQRPKVAFLVHSLLILLVHEMFLYIAWMFIILTSSQPQTLFLIPMKACTSRGWLWDGTSWWLDLRIHFFCNSCSAIHWASKVSKHSGPQRWPLQLPASLSISPLDSLPPLHSASMLFLKPRFHVPAGSHHGSLGGGELFSPRLCVLAPHLIAGSKRMTKQSKKGSVVSELRYSLLWQGRHGGCRLGQVATLCL